MGEARVELLEEQVPPAAQQGFVLKPYQALGSRVFLV